MKEKEDKENKKKGFKFRGQVVPKSLNKALPKYDSTKAVAELASKTGALVRQGRTGYFNDEYAREVKWLS